MTTSKAESMVEMRNNGATYQEIGEKFGITRQYAHKIINKLFFQRKEQINGRP